MREQPEWPAHRDFMNALPDGFVLLGGPVDGHRSRAMLIVKAEDAAAVRNRLAPDPWVRDGVLVQDVEPWELLIGSLP